MQSTLKEVAKQGLTIGMIPGDGIGRVVLPAAQEVLSKVKGIPRVEFIPLDAGFEFFQKHKTALPVDTVQALKTKCNCAMFGAVSSPSSRVEGYSSPIVQLRKIMGLYANVRPVKTTEGVPGGIDKDVDMTIVRENTECLYIKQETLTEEATGAVAIASRRITEAATRKVAEMAVDIARNGVKSREASGRKTGWQGPPTVTVIHKANVLAVSDGLFREVCLRVGKENPDIVMNEQIVDSAVYKLFREPEKMSTLVAPNLYGDIISDGAAALVGSLGLVPSVNVGQNFIVGEPVHGSAPDIADRTPSIANPIASIRSAALMLEFMDFIEASADINRAVDEALRDGFLTPDLGGTSTTQDVTEAVVKRLKN